MDKSRNKLRLTLVAAGLVLLCLAAYEQVRECGFVWDDEIYIEKCEQVKNGLSRDSVIWAFTHYVGYWHPVTSLSLMLDCELFGVDPGWHHIVNLLLHTANALLLFWLIQRATGAFWSSAFVAALFAVHPLSVESVAFIAERKNVLSTLFWLLTIAAYFHYVKRPSAIRYCLVLLLFLAGLMAKPMLVTVPLTLLILDFWPLRRLEIEHFSVERGDRTEACASLSPGFRLFMEKVPLIIMSLASACMSVISARGLGIMHSAQIAPAKLRIANALVSYPRYIGKIIWPKDLAFFYPFPSSIGVVQTVAATIMLLCVTALAIYLARRRPYFIAGWLWYLVTLVPVLGLVRAGLWPAMADRFTYVPSIGLFIVGVWTIRDLAAKWRYRTFTLGLSAGIVLVLLVICTRKQVTHWRDNLALLERAANVTENNSFALFNLGNELTLHGRTDEAINRYQEVLQLRPNHAMTHNNLGGLLHAKGRLDEALHHFRRATELDPSHPKLRLNLGKVLSSMSRFEEAIRSYSEAIEIRPDLAGALNALAWIYAANPEPTLRDADQAIALAKRAAQATGYRHPIPLDTLGAAYAAGGQFSEAIETAQTALKLAQSMGDKKLTESIQKRLALYKEGQPYIDGRRP